MLEERPCIEKVQCHSNRGFLAGAMAWAGGLCGFSTLQRCACVAVVPLDSSLRLWARARNNNTSGLRSMRELLA